MKTVKVIKVMENYNKAWKHVQKNIFFYKKINYKISCSIKIKYIFKQILLILMNMKFLDNVINL